MDINPNTYTREQINALALEVGVEQAAIDAADTKADVVALIEAKGGSDADRSGIMPPQTDPGPEPTPEPVEDTGEFPGYFIVADQKVDFNGKPYKKG